MPQWDFLDFLREEARHYPAFHLRMEAEAVDLLFEGDRVAGVRLKDGEEIRARLTIAADGRSSILRDKAGLAEDGPRRADRRVLVPAAQGADADNETGGTFGAGTLVVEIDRGDYWQCAYVVPKGAADEIRAKGIDAFRDDVAARRARARRRRSTRCRTGTR